LLCDWWLAFDWDTTVGALLELPWLAVFVLSPVRVVCAGRFRLPLPCRLVTVAVFDCLLCCFSFEAVCVPVGSVRFPV